MTDNVIKMQKEGPPDILVGPFEVYNVVVEGRHIPLLSGYQEGDKIAIVVDHRWSATFGKEDAHQVAWLLAQAIAVSQGYSNMHAGNKDVPFAPQVAEIKL